MRLGHVDIGQRSETVRRANLRAIVRGLHERGPLSRSELVIRDRPHPQRHPRAGRRADAAGLVAEEPAIRLGTPGRPSPLVRLKPGAAAVLALEILVDSMAAAIVGLGGAVLEHGPRRPARGGTCPWTRWWTTS